MSVWAPAGAERFGLFDGGAASDAVANTGLRALSTPAQAYADEGKPWHPANPLFAFGVLAALTVGLMAVSTSGGGKVRVGHTVAGVSGAAGIGS